jgi:hypothetical protein
MAGTIISDIQRERDAAQQEAERLVFNPEGITRSEEQRVHELIREIDRLDLRLDAAEAIGARVLPPPPASGDGRDAGVDDASAEVPVVSERQRARDACWLDLQNSAHSDWLARLEWFRVETARRRAYETVCKARRAGRPDLG